MWFLIYSQLLHHVTIMHQNSECTGPITESAAQVNRKTKKRSRKKVIKNQSSKQTAVDASRKGWYKYPNLNVIIYYISITSILNTHVHLSSFDIFRVRVPASISRAWFPEIYFSVVYSRMIINSSSSYLCEFVYDHFQ